MRRRILVKRVDIKELYERLFKKLDCVYEKIKKKKRGRPKKSNFCSYLVSAYSFIIYFSNTRG